VWTQSVILSFSSHAHAHGIPLNLPCLEYPRVHTTQQSIAPSCVHCALLRSTEIPQLLLAWSTLHPSHRSSELSFQETSPSCCQQSIHQRWSKFFPELPGVPLVSVEPFNFLFTHQDVSFQCCQPLNELVVDICRHLMCAWQLCPQRSWPHCHEAFSKQAVIRNGKCLHSEINIRCLTNFIYTYLVTTGNELCHRTQNSFSRELLWSFRLRHHPIKCPLLISFWILSFLHLFPNRSGDGMVVLWYVLFLASCFIELIMVPAMCATGRVTACVKCLPQPLLRYKFLIIPLVCQYSV
jgi:hypothetical protein